jgi:hypothetical protein
MYVAGMTYKLSMCESEGVCLVAAHRATYAERLAAKYVGNSAQCDNCIINISGSAGRHHKY